MRAPSLGQPLTELGPYGRVEIFRGASMISTLREEKLSTAQVGDQRTPDVRPSDSPVGGPKGGLLPAASVFMFLIAHHGHQPCPYSKQGSSLFDVSHVQGEAGRKEQCSIAC